MTEPTIVDYSRTTVHDRAALDHIHDTDGICRKNRDGELCEQPERHWLDGVLTSEAKAPEVINADSGEVRHFSDTGAAKGAKPARFDMLPMDSLWELAEQFGKGAEKYEEVNGLDNWRNGYGWHLSFGAAFRHLSLALGGEDIDPETGQKHVIAVAWHMLVLAHWMNNPEMARFDTRQDAIEKRRRAAAFVGVTL